MNIIKTGVISYLGALILTAALFAGAVSYAQTTTPTPTPTTTQQQNPSGAPNTGGGWAGK
ncbi:hypothetical protein HGB07_01380 [Candidatus Roizmanbacteria bacterium]|nr:hypothetical protein [Candidatus Roizmanbacteria bacterium]